MAVYDSNVQAQLEQFLCATSRAGVANVLIIALDERLARFLDGLGVAYGCGRTPPAAAVRTRSRRRSSSSSGRSLPAARRCS